jgi:hypothetical protein
MKIIKFNEHLELAIVKRSLIPLKNSVKDSLLSDDHIPKHYYCGYIGTTKKPNSFLTKLALRCRGGNTRRCYLDVYCFNYFNLYNSTVENGFNAYLGFDTYHIDPVSDKINNTNSEKRIEMELRRGAADFQKLADSYGFKAKALYLTDALNNF